MTIAGEGRILTAGGFDSQIHFICPQQIEDALHSGLTTMLGGGTGPAHGTLATTCTPGPWHIGRMLQAADAFPISGSRGRFDTLESFDARMLCGESTLEPRVVACPVRVPYPDPPTVGSIYEVQKQMDPSRRSFAVAG